MGDRSTATKVALTSIQIEQIEGEVKNLTRATVRSWTHAMQILARICEKAPAGGGYLKTDCRVTWVDGFTTTYRFDASPTEDPNLGALIRKHWQFYAGFWRPEKMTEAVYDAMVAEDPRRRDQATKALQTYALEDGPDAPALPGFTSGARPAVPAAAPTPAAKPVSASEVKEVREALTMLASRATKAAATDEQMERLSYHLRRALVSLLAADGVFQPPKG